MGLLLLGLLYAFGAACFVNYFVMFARIRTTEKYIERREKLLAAHEALHGPVTAETESATPPPPPPPLLLRAEPLRVVFLHPDLGIGGAERLIVDAAVGLQRCQSIQPVEVTIVTNHHDPTRAFAETTNGMVRVVVRGSRLPASILGRAKVLCATLRMGFAAFATCWAFPDTDCFVVDQVAAAMPVLNICAGKTPILFYSHFPDQLCNSNRNADGTFKTSSGSASAAHETYRGLFDQVEASSMNFATSIVCNSKFSRQVSVDTFPALAERIREDADIFYPPVEMKVREVAASVLAESAPLRELHAAVRDAVTFVSINRYERKKNVALAIEAFARVLAMDEFKAAEGRRPLMLVVAGGCDPRQEEDVQHADELVALATGKLQIPASQVRFLKNITDEEKAVLLSEMRALVYTPSREHFGIVPVEAMAYAKPVVAIADGGPCESVGDVEHEDPALCGGLLSSPEPSEFAEKMACFARDADYAAKVGAQGRARVVEKFSMETFSTQLATRLVELRAAADNKLLAEGIEFAKKEAASKAGKAAAKEKRE